MISSYGVSLVGTDHIKNGIVCQDYHKIAHSGKNIAIAAVADGLGSAARSDIGSKIAATIAVEYCQKHINAKTKQPQILTIIKGAFFSALNALEKEAAIEDHPIEVYDTTLTLAVLIRDVLYYGHSGDSGMLVLTTQGRYESVTVQQRDSDGHVFPLFFEDKWEFGQYDKKVASVLLATDGMLETFYPIYIKNSFVNIRVSLAQFFMDNRHLCIHKSGDKSIQDVVTTFMENIPDNQVSDDKTVVVLINTAIKTKLQPADYYIEPDWEELKKKHNDAWRREAYPSLYKDEFTDITENEITAPNELSPEKSLTKIQATKHQIANILSKSELLDNPKVRLWLISIGFMVLLVVLAFIIFPISHPYKADSLKTDYAEPNEEHYTNSETNGEATINTDIVVGAINGEASGSAELDDEE